MDTLGGQTVTVYERVRGEHREYRDAAATSHPGCSVQPEPSGGERTTDGRAGQTRRWKLFAPPGLRASASAQCTVVPGPVDDQGAPARLSFDGAAEAHYDLDGAEDHVTAVLTLS